MSGPVGAVDASPEPQHGHAGPPRLEVTDSHTAQVGRIQVRRALPRRGRRTVGAWCFADHMGPAEVTENASIDVGPHPHMGLQTVTWLLDGHVLHRDSLGSEQVVSPGQLNLMTAGAGVSHSEEATGHYRGDLEGIQLWVAQPDETRFGAPAFEHHSVLPRVNLGQSTATVLIGELMGVASPARYDTPLVGAELHLAGGGVEVEVRRDWEYAVIVLRGRLAVDGEELHSGQLGYLGCDRQIVVVDGTADTRAIMLGGEPFPEPILMWWNFVARTRDELAAAYESWRDDDGRFGTFASPLRRIPVPAPYWLSGS